MSAILLDTSYLISLVDPNRPNHETAVSYLREALRRGVPLYLSAIAASEFQVRQQWHFLKQTQPGFCADAVRGARARHVAALSASGVV